MAKRENTGADNSSRKRALAARPIPTRAVAWKELEDGGVRLTVLFESSRWQRFMGAPKEYERNYDLDALGREVYELCNGRNRVRDIIKHFIEVHHLTPPEAERAVTMYLKTLVGKGVVNVAVSKEVS